ncbi:MAG: response regulator [Planctomycetota bacterium]|nr:response regulator [Planctomycetota bacterium]
MQQASTILIIEDDAAAADDLAALCQQLGHTPLVAHDGATGLKLAVNELPRLILSDIRVPGLDGFEVPRRLRGDRRLDKTAIVAVTTHPPTAPAANQRTFDDYLLKPFTPCDLKHVISKYC